MYARNNRLTSKIPGSVKVSAKPKVLIKNNQLFTKKEKKILSKSIKELAAQSNNSASLKALTTRLSQESVQNAKVTPILKKRNSQESLEIENTKDAQLEGDPETANIDEGISTLENKINDIPRIEEINTNKNHKHLEIIEKNYKESLTMTSQKHDAPPETNCQQHNGHTEFDNKHS